MLELLTFILDYTIFPIFLATYMKYNCYGSSQTEINKSQHSLDIISVLESTSIGRAIKASLDALNSFGIYKAVHWVSPRDINGQIPNTTTKFSLTSKVLDGEVEADCC